MTASPHTQFSGFLPLRLITRLADEGDRPAETRFLGTALFADISGYTRLTEQLCGAGDEGLERLSQILNRSFSRYVDLVYAHGGEVAYFAGDALLATWDDDAGPGSSRRAMACAKGLRALTESEDEIRQGNPELHLGLAAGALWAARLGGWFGGWEMLVGGEAVRNAFRSATRARAGEIVVHELDPMDSVTGLPVPAPVPPPAPRDDPWYQALLPRVVRERAGAGWMGELRMVSSLFVRIDGLDESRDDALPRAQAVVFALHEALRGSSGSAGRLVLDDKGLVFALVLGDPFNAHADDLTRAMHTGLTLERELARAGFSCSMGFASGRAFCGVIGSDVRRQYVVIGRPMNLAARLMQMAGTGLLAAGPLSPDRLSGLACTPEATITPKGFGRTVETFRVTRRQAEAPARLFGRGPELEALGEALDDLATGQGGVLLVTGDAGLGKSRLVQEAVGRAGVRAVVGHADAAEVSTSYYAWRGAFRALIEAGDLLSADSAGRMRTRQATPEELRALLPERLRPGGKDAALAPLLGAVLPLEIPENATTGPLSGQSRADATMELLLTLLEEAAGRPLLIVLEDCHWMDSASCRLAERLASRVRNVLLLLTSRPMQARPELQPLHQHPRFRELPLTPLDPAAIEALLRARVGAEVAPEVVEEIEAQTGGNPFFVQEYLLYLRETNRLKLREGRLALEGRSQEGAPAPRLQGIVTSRLDTLSPGDQRVLKTASAIGQVFPVRLLAQLTPGPAGEVNGALAALASHQLVAPADESGSLFRFAHALIRNVAYDLMLFEQRRVLHRQIAEQLEAGPSSGVSAGPALLFHHWAAASDDGKTLHYADLAADEALRLGAYREAISFLQRCQDLAARTGAPAPRSLPHIRWRRQMSEAAGQLGDLAARRGHAEVALTIADRAPSLSRTTAVALTVARLGWRALRRRIPPRPRAAPTAETRAFELELARAHRQLAVVAYFGSDPVGIVRHAASALVHAERAGPSADLSGVLVEMGACFGLAGFGGIARRYMAKAVRVGARFGDLGALAYAHMVRCLYFVGRGDWDAVRAAADEGQAMCEALGDHVNWANAQVVRFWMHHYQGEDEPARAAADGLLVRSDRTGNLQQKAWALRCLAVCDLRAGAVAEAVSHLETALDVLSGSKDLNEVVPTWGTLALARYRRGDVGAALQLARRALHATLESGRPTGHATLEGCSATIEVLMGTLDPRAAGSRRLAKQCLRALRRYARVFPVGEPRYHLWQGHRLLVFGRPRAAVAAWNKGLAAAQALGMGADARLLEARLRG
jgi:class 3 adenylate cyclase/tetratricopeptide (TPR) repeat protein